MKKINAFVILMLSFLLLPGAQAQIKSLPEAIFTTGHI